MTTKPKAKKFRIRRNAPLSGDDTPEASAGAEAMPATEPGRVTPRRPGATAAPAASAPAAPASPAAAAAAAAPAAPAPGADRSAGEEINEIRQEGITGRQLRMARRIAQKHGIAATSDFDAVRQLRAKGIEPFERANMLELVPGGDTRPKPATAPVQLPQTVDPAAPNLPSTETMSPAERRARDVASVQRDIAARRRRRLMLLLTRLGVFVFLPTLIVGYYFYVLAHPMYSTKTEFLILQADATGGGAFGGLLSGTQFATNQDAIATQSYLQSKDAMTRLDADEGFKAHFTQEEIDPIQRLDPNPSNEQAYKVYKKNVKIGYDPTEGVVRMEVIAADPEVAARFSRALISYAEERVDDLSRRKRDDQMRDARASLETAKQERREAQQQLVRMQEGSLLDPEAVIGSLRSQINNVEIQLQEKKLQLQQLLDNRRPNQARVQGVEGDIGRLEALLAQLQARMTDATAGEQSLAQQTVQIQMAQADLATADMFLQSALQNLKQTEQEANRQVRYLTTSVEPVASQDPSYPRKFENTILAFLIFSGIYLMISLTASILREQVSS